MLILNDPSASIPPTGAQQHIQRQIEQQLDMFDHSFVADERGRPVHWPLEHIAELHAAAAAAGRTRIAHPHRTIAALSAARLVASQRTAESALFISAAFIAAERGKLRIFFTAGRNDRNKIPYLGRLRFNSTGSSYPFRNGPKMCRQSSYLSTGVSSGRMRSGIFGEKKIADRFVCGRDSGRISQGILSPNFRMNAVTDLTLTGLYPNGSGAH